MWEREIKDGKKIFSTITVNICQFSICHTFSYKTLLSTVACFRHWMYQNQLKFVLWIRKSHIKMIKTNAWHSYFHVYQQCNRLLWVSACFHMRFFFSIQSKLIWRDRNTSTELIYTHFYRFCWKKAVEREKKKQRHSQYYIHLNTLSTFNYFEFYIEYNTFYYAVLKILSYTFCRFK